MNSDNWVIKPPDVSIKNFSDNDFESLSWHDVPVRGFYFDDVENSFMLLIDYVLEWIHPNVHKIDNTYRHWQIPSILKFIWINDIEVNLKWKNWAMQLSIDEIVRKKILPPTKASTGTFYRYEINFSVPRDGKIILPIATSFGLHLLGEPYLYDNDENYKKYLRELMKSNIDKLLKFF